MTVTIPFASAHNITGLSVQLFDALSDSYVILGGDRVKSDTQTSLTVTSTATQIVFTGRYRRFNQCLLPSS